MGTSFDSIVTRSEILPDNQSQWLTIAPKVKF